MDFKLLALIEKIELRYNAENDVTPGGPMVTWAEYELVQMVKLLAARVDTLEKQAIETEDAKKRMARQVVESIMAER